MKRRKFIKPKRLKGKRSGLELLIEQKIPKKFRSKVKYEPIKLTYQLPKTYVPDFVLNDKIIIEAKGYLRYEDQVKMRAVKASNPFLDIRFIFSPTSRVARSQMTPQEWCEKYSFPYAVGEIPKGWYLE